MLNGEIVGALEASVVFYLLVPLLVLCSFGAVRVSRKRLPRTPSPLLILLALWAIVALAVV